MGVYEVFYRGENFFVVAENIEEVKLILEENFQDYDPEENCIIESKMIPIRFIEYGCASILRAIANE